MKSKTAVTSDLVIDGDVDGLVGRQAKHKGFPHTGELLGAHQAEEGPLGDVRHGALAAKRWRRLEPEATSPAPQWRSILADDGMLVEAGKGSKIFYIFLTRS